MRRLPKTLIDALPIRVDHKRGCWLWMGRLSACGYAEEGKNSLVHRRIYKQLHGHLPRVVMHTCDVRNCVNPAHLKGGTHAENTHDMMQKGRHANGARRLTPLLVKRIVQLLAQGVRGRHIAGRFGLSESTVSKIRLGRHWNWLTGVLP